MKEIIRRKNLKSKINWVLRLMAVLFPTPRAWMNFVLIWVFLLILATNREQLIVLVSGLGTLYCLNEWSKAMREKKQ